MLIKQKQIISKVSQYPEKASQNSCQNNLNLNQTETVKIINKDKVLPIFIKKISDCLGRQNLAILLVSIASFTYPISFLYANQNNLHFVQTTLVRGIAGFLIVYAIIVYYKIEIDFKIAKDLCTINIRNTIMIFYSFVFTLSQFYLQQPILQTLNSCGPIFIFIIDYFLNNVKINQKQFIGILLAIGGVLLTVYGRLLTQLLISPQQKSQQQFQSQFKNYYTTNPTVKMMAGCILLFSISAWGYGQVITKRLISVNFIHLNIHLAIFMTIFSGLVYPILVKNPVQLNTFFNALIFCGIPSTISSLLFIGAITISQHTGVLTLFQFISVIVGYFVSIFRYKERLSILCLLGTLFLIVHRLTQHFLFIIFLLILLVY